MFQSTPARGGRPRPSTCSWSRSRFQSTPARGGRRNIGVTGNLATKFQSTPARGGRPCPGGHTGVARARFNPRPHAAGDSARRVASRRLRRFNPRPHAAGDAATGSESHTIKMFQSTPARGGRRRVLDDGSLEVIVSIHARTRRATSGARVGTAGGTCFNPRPHAAGDRQRRHGQHVHVVSIHARTRRATLGSVTTPFCFWFQSTPARGGRPGVAETAYDSWQFQSTPARGGRHRPELQGEPRYLFQSTPARGGRPRVVHIYQAVIEFQSTPARGGRPMRRCISPAASWFQSTPARGGRRVRQDNGNEADHGFNPRPHAAGDLSRIRLAVRR